MIKGIHHIAVHVRDMDRMIAFYQDAFGFALIGEPYEWRDDPGIDSVIGVPGSAARTAMMRAGACCIELFQFSAPPGEERPLRAFDRGYTHFCLQVTDADSEVTRLTGLGMTFVRDEPVNRGRSKSLYGRDPEGNLVEILQMVAEHPWQSANASAGS